MAVLINRSSASASEVFPAAIQDYGRGVVPDVAFPQLSNGETDGESSYDNPLPWSKIKAADFTPFADLRDHIATLQQKHKARIAKDKAFQYWLEEVEESRKQQKDESVSLNEAIRRKEADVRQARMKARHTTKDISLVEAARVMADEVELQHRSAVRLGDKTAAGMAGLFSRSATPKIRLVSYQAMPQITDGGCSSAPTQATAVAQRLE